MLSGIKDGLNEIVYDENGNPISLDDTTISWTNGRQLESFNTVDENGNEVPFLSFTYDDSGIRTSKTFGDTTTYYTNINGNVTSQYQLDENGNIINLAEFIYDSANEVIGFTYEGETYFYLKNLQNDVLGVIDSNGVLMAEYEYFAWGLHMGSDYSDNSIYDVNPFRYRSYIYDEEMSMCYLQSRYYITNFGRFLNADLPEYAQVQKGDHAGLNLFAYCCNDPVNYVDYYGTFTLTMTAIYCGIVVIGLCVLAMFYVASVSRTSWSGQNLQSWTSRRFRIAKHIPVAVFSSIVLLAKQSKLSQKARSTDAPSWISNFPPPHEDETGEQYAKRICDAKYGRNNYKKGPGSEYNKIKKFAQRNLNLK